MEGKAWLLSKYLCGMWIANQETIQLDPQEI